jgi:hypothetical protein
MVKEHIFFLVSRNKTTVSLFHETRFDEKACCTNTFRRKSLFRETNDTTLVLRETTKGVLQNHFVTTPKATPTVTSVI